MNSSDFNERKSKIEIRFIKFALNFQMRINDCLIITPHNTQNMSQVSIDSDAQVQDDQDRLAEHTKLDFSGIQLAHERTFLTSVLKELLYRRGPVFFPDLFCDPAKYSEVSLQWSPAAVLSCPLRTVKWDDPIRYAFIYRWYSPGRCVEIEVPSLRIPIHSREPPHLGHVFMGMLVKFHYPPKDVTMQPKRRQRIEADEDDEDPFTRLGRALVGD